MTDNTKQPATGPRVSEHTPTPWKVWYTAAGPRIKTPGNQLIARVTGEDTRACNSNAELIVRAVNSHAKLVEALEYARNMARPDSGPESTQALPPSSYEWEQLRLKADEALKLAKGVA